MLPNICIKYEQNAEQFTFFNLKKRKSARFMAKICVFLTLYPLNWSLRYRNVAKNLNPIWINAEKWNSKVHFCWIMKCSSRVQMAVLRIRIIFGSIFFYHGSIENNLCLWNSKGLNIVWHIHLSQIFFGHSFIKNLNWIIFSGKSA